MSELNDTSLISDANLLAYFRQEAGALTTDSKGSNTLTNNNSVAEGTGKYGGCSDFGDPNTNKFLSRAARITSARDNFSIVGWVYCHNINQFGELFFNGAPGGSATQGWGLYISKASTPGSAGSRLFVLDGAIGWLETTYDFSVTAWTHVALVNDGVHTRVYANGIQVLEADWPQFGAPSDLCSIGAGYCGGSTSDYFKGKIDDVAVFDRALTVDEILLLVNEVTVTVNKLKYYRRTRFPGPIAGI
jgi:hypothetical protein